MPPSPFRSKSTIDQVRETADDARAGVIEAAEGVREQAERLSSELKLAERTEPVRRPSRRALAFAGAVAVAVAIALRLRKRTTSVPESGVPQPDVTPTTPGPAGGELNDPALKAKVESELFRDPDVPKDRILIGVAGGVVTLRGDLGSEQAEKLISRAEEIEGVREVENLLNAGNGATGEQSGTA
jgi:hypothetical protein